MKNLSELPRGKWHNTLDVDGYDQPVHLEALLTIGDSGVDIDFKGTSKASGFGINVPPAYTRAYSAFAVKCIVAPEIPNNAGSLEPIRTTIPKGSILNAPRPFPVAVRHVIGHMLPDLIFGCLHQASEEMKENQQGIGERFSRGMPAEGAGTIWNPQLRGGKVMPEKVMTGGNSGFQHRHLQQWRNRCKTEQRRTLCHRIPEWSQDDAGGGHRKCSSRPFQEKRISA